MKADVKSLYRLWDVLETQDTHLFKSMTLPMLSYCPYPTHPSGLPILWYSPARARTTLQVPGLPARARTLPRARTPPSTISKKHIIFPANGWLGVDGEVFTSPYNHVSRRVFIPVPPPLTETTDPRLTKGHIHSESICRLRIFMEHLKKIQVRF